MHAATPIWAFLAVFQKFVPLKGRKTSVFLPFFSAIWAFSRHFLIFVPFSCQLGVAKQEQKGTKMKNSSENAQSAPPQPGIPLEFVVQRGTKFSKTRKNAQWQHKSLLVAEESKFQAASRVVAAANKFDGCSQKFTCGLPTEARPQPTNLLVSARSL